MKKRLKDDAAVIELGHIFGSHVPLNEGQKRWLVIPYSRRLRIAQRIAGPLPITPESKRSNA